MSADELAVIAGSILSLVFSYIPGLNAKFAALAPEVKRAIMLGLVVLVAAVAYALACAGLGSDFGLAVTCDRPGLVALFRAVVFGMMANQGTFQLTKPAK